MFASDGATPSPRPHSSPAGSDGGRLTSAAGAVLTATLDARFAQPIPPLKVSAVGGSRGGKHEALVSTARVMLDHFRRRGSSGGPGVPALSGRACQLELQERWSELHAWCGAMASHLDGACTLIEALADDARRLERVQTESQNTLRQLEHRCSRRNVDALEQTVEQQREELRTHEHAAEELRAALAARDARIRELEHAMASARP